ncbi:hypothetical protein COV89_00240, partial [Candidatus Shapirobacteria bacterium CG11_big_fil_rev_8_21_14_0_20_40_12]
MGYNGQNYSSFTVGTDGALAIATTNNATTSINAGLTVNTNSLVVQDATGYVGIGTTNPHDLLWLEKNQNGETHSVLVNSNAGALATAELIVSNDNSSSLAAKTAGLRLITLGTGFTNNGGFMADTALIDADSGLSGGLNIMTRATAPIRFYTSGHENA